MAQVTVVGSKKSSVSAVTSDEDYRRNDAKDEPELVGLHIQKTGAGWKVTEEAELNNRTSTKDKRFDSLDAAQSYAMKCLQSASGDEQEPDEEDGPVTSDGQIRTHDEMMARMKAKRTGAVQSRTGQKGATY